MLYKFWKLGIYHMVLILVHRNHFQKCIDIFFCAHIAWKNKNDSLKYKILLLKHKNCSNSVYILWSIDVETLYKLRVYLV
jgi:hypothetical protein